MSEQKARDKQFQNFANALYMECFNVHQEAELNGRMHAEQYVIQHIARRSYDLAKHTMSHVTQGMAAENEGGPKYLEENVRYIPDMTELPKEQGEQQ